MTVRCAQLIETLQVGGAENLAVQIANGFARRGFDSSLIVVEELGHLADRVDPAVDLHFLDFRRASIANPLRFTASIRNGFRLIDRVVREQRLQVIQTHLPGANFWGLALSLRHRAAVVATVHNNEEFRYGDTDDPLRGRLRRWAYKRILRDGAATVAVSERVADSLLIDLGLSAAHRRCITVVPNGVAVPDPLPPDQSAAIRSRLGVPESVPLVVAAGRHGEQKSFATLIEAAQKLHQKNIPFRLIIAGEGPLLAEHRRQVATANLGSHVDLPGVLMDLTAILQVADVFVLPSRWEGLPLVLLEAMAAETAVVGSRIPGIAEVVEDRVNGLLVPPGDAVRLAQMLAGVLADAPLRAKLAKAALNAVRARYDLETVLNRLASLYGGLVSPFSST